MKKTFFLLFYFLILGDVCAEDALFAQQGETLGQVKTLQMPECNDKDFETKIIETAKKYFEKQPAFSTVQKRKQFLTLKNLKDFERVSAQNFLPETDFNTANALITIKINEHVDEKDILLCRQKEHDQTPVYVIAFPYMDNVKAYVINLAQNNPDHQAVWFVYP